MHTAFGCHGCTGSFNRDISSWDVSKVTNMVNMFYSSIFNQDISSWDVSKVQLFGNMLGRCFSFQQTLCGPAWVIHAGKEEGFSWSSGAKISLAVDTCSKCSLILNDGIFCAAPGRRNGLILSSVAMCKGSPCKIDVDAKTCCACDVSDGTLSNEFACACGTSSTLMPAFCAGGEFCNAQAHLCATHPIPTCEYRDGFRQNPSGCACGLTLCDTSNPFCNALQSDCRSFPMCSHGNGKQANSERCSCGTSYCDSGQFCYKLNSQCRDDSNTFYTYNDGDPPVIVLGPVCDFTDGSAPHNSSTSCICGSSGYCDFKEGYCYAPFSECTQVPDPDRVNECAYTGNEAKNTVACVCGGKVCEPNYNGPFCLASSSLCSCAPGSYLIKYANTCAKCDPGMYGDVLGLVDTCKHCTAGTYSEEYGMSSSSSCINCPAGRSSIHWGAHSLSTCEECPKGSFAAPPGGQVACEICAPGRKAENFGQHNCTSCPKGYFNQDNQISAAAHESCLSCINVSGFPVSGPGPESEEGAYFCSNCPTGTYNDRNGSVTSPCLFCPSGWFEEAKKCTMCKQGQYQPDEGKTLCFPCLPGFFMNKSGSKECNSCAVGHFQREQGNTTCIPCKRGQYQAKKGSPSCSTCIPGRANNKTGMTACVECKEKTYAPHSRAYTCKNCRSGRTSVNGSASCSPCVPGTFVTSDNACNDCPAGFFSNEQNAIKCHPCAAGRAARTPHGSARCAQCFPGFFVNKVDRACVQCPQGFVSSILSATNCTSCRIGTESLGEGKTFCSPCDLGKHGIQVSNSVKCVICERGRFQDDKGATSCKLCTRRGEIPNDKSTACMKPNHKIAVDCTDTFFLDDRSAEPKEWKCIKCPEGGYCRGEVSFRHGHVLAKFGWWRIPETVLNTGKNYTPSFPKFAECQYPPACQGAPNEKLAGNYFADDDRTIDLAVSSAPLFNRSNNISYGCATQLGFRNHSRLCSTCARNHRRIGNFKCAVCPSMTQSYALIALGGLVLLLVTLFVARTGISDVGEVKLPTIVNKIFLNYLQVSALALHFPLRWPSALQNLFEAQGSISTIGGHLVNPDCVSDASAASIFYSKQIAFATAPVVTLVVAFTFWFGYGRWSNTPFFNKRASSNTTTPKDMFVVTVGVILYLVYPTIATQAFRLFSCLSVGEGMYLVADLEEPCYKGRHLLMVLVLGLGQVVAYVIGLPTLLLVFLLRNRTKLDNSFAVKVRYGLFYSAYRSNRFFWEVVITARKVFMVVLSVFGQASLGKHLQAMMTLTILLISITAEILGNPYNTNLSPRHSMLPLMELSTLLVLWFTMWCGTVIYTLQEQGSGDIIIQLLTAAVAITNAFMSLFLFFDLIIEVLLQKKSRLAKSVIKIMAKNIIFRKLLGFGEMKTVDTNAILEPKADASRFIDNPLTKPGVVELATVHLASMQSFTRHITADDQEYFVPVDGGEPLWELPENGVLKRDKQESTTVQRFIRHTTTDNQEYFVPVDGSESVWELPENAVLVEADEDEDVDE